MEISNEKSWNTLINLDIILKYKLLIYKKKLGEFYGWQESRNINL
jgi:hypothetical protein